MDSTFWRSPQKQVHKSDWSFFQISLHTAHSWRSRIQSKSSSCREAFDSSKEVSCPSNQIMESKGKTQPHTKLEKPPAFLISKLFKVIAAKNLKMWVRRVNHSKKNTKKELKQNTHQQNLIWEDTRSQCSCKDGVMACGSKSAQAVFEVACWFKPGDQPVQHSQVRQPMWDIV